jgi:cytochrome c
MKLPVIFIIPVIIINISCTDPKQPAGNNNGDSQGMGEAKAITASPNGKSVQNSKYEFPDNNGIGPIKELSVGAIDQNLVLQGRKIFTTQCISCHQIDSRSVGPPLRNITKKNTPVYIMNYLLNTIDMQKKDPQLQKLVDEYKVVMPDQQLTRDDARAVLEYFRSVDK